MYARMRACFASLQPAAMPTRAVAGASEQVSRWRWTLTRTWAVLSVASIHPRVGSAICARPDRAHM
eukprot:5594895-Alexandrium_andersonii.AAC.1